MRHLVKSALYCAAAFVLAGGSAYAQSTVEVYKSPT